MTKFAGILDEYGLRRVTSDAYAGETFRADFEEHGIRYAIAGTPKSDLYDALEPKLNAGEVELLDDPKLQEQLLTLVWRGNKIDHQSGDHDDYANAAAGAIWLAIGKQRSLTISDSFLAATRRPGLSAQHGGFTNSGPVQAFFPDRILR